MSDPPPSMPPESASGPTLLGGRYALLERLGVGGMSTVYRAWDTRLEVFRAVKILAARLASKRGVRQRLENEAKVMARLAHPNIVTLFEMGEDGDQLFLVMELVAGGSVMERVAQDGHLPPRMACRVALEVLSALDATHAVGVVHRDIKPHNVLLDVNGVAKVTDFGIARHDDLAGLTRTGAVMGTLAYMPPEQKLSARKVDLRSDLYAVGGTLYCLLTAKEPFDLYAAAMDEQLAADFFQGVHPSLARVIARATAFRQEDRYSSAAEMREALVAAMEDLGEDPPAPPLVPAERMQRVRELASFGPTLLALGTHESHFVHTSPTTNVSPEPALPTTPPPRDEPPPEAPVVAPALQPEPESSPRWPWLAAGLMLAGVLVIGLGGVVGLGSLAWFQSSGGTTPVAAPDPDPVPPDPPEVAPTPEPSPAPVVQPPEGPAAPTGPAPSPTPAPVPTPGRVPAPAPELTVSPAPEVVVAPAPVAVPAPQVVAPSPTPDPAPAAPRATPGSWNVQVTSSGRAKADVLARLRADADVEDRLGRVGRPELLIKCSNGKPSVILRSGVQAVEPLIYEGGIEVAFSEVVFDGSEKFKAANDPAVKNELRFNSNERGWVTRLLGRSTFTFGYRPSSSPMVTARFTNGNVAELNQALTAHCGF